MRDTRIKFEIVALSIAAVLALSMIPATSASAALPEIGPAGPFTGTGGASTLETKSGEKLKCSISKVSGKITGPKTVSATVTFTGCEWAGFKCRSPGASAGEIVVKGTGTLVYQIKPSVMLLFALTATVTVECSVFQILHVKGSFAISLGPIDTRTIHFSLKGKETKGVQEPTEYETPSGEKVKAPIAEINGEGLKTFMYEQSGLSSEDALTFESETEIVA